jgi:hypothetical protein
VSAPRLNYCCQSGLQRADTIHGVRKGHPGFSLEISGDGKHLYAGWSDFEKGCPQAPLLTPIAAPPACCGICGNSSASESLADISLQSTTHQASLRSTRGSGIIALTAVEITDPFYTQVGLFRVLWTWMAASATTVGQNPRRAAVEVFIRGSDLVIVPKRPISTLSYPCSPKPRIGRPAKKPGKALFFRALQTRASL